MSTKQVELNSSELKGFMKHIITNNRHLQEQGKNPVSIEVVGESGIGKTSTLIQIAEEEGLHMQKLNLAQIEELGDLVGFPIRQFQMAKQTEDGKWVMKWADENLVEDYRAKGYQSTGKSQMSYCPPEWIADKKGGGILMLDDWNRADIRFIQAVMELVDRQEYISWKLPKDWHIVLTSNPDDGDYLVQSIDTAQRTRFITVNLKFETETWAKWAEEAGIDSRCINFLLMHPELVTKETNARSITTFFNAISSFKDFSSQLLFIQMIGEGSVGPEFASLFTQFINNKLDKLIDPKTMLTNESDEGTIQMIKAATGTDDDYRADIASVLATRLANYTLHYAETNAVTEKIIKRLTLLTTEEDLFANDLNYFVIREILNGNKTKFQKLMMNPEIVKMATR